MTDLAKASDVEKKRLLWRCRQGTLELELLLYRFIDAHYASLSEQDTQTLQALVEYDQNLLSEWLLNGKEPENKKIRELVKAILNTKKPL